MTNKTDNEKLISASIRVGRNAMLKHNFAEAEMIENLGVALQAAQEEIEQLRNDTKEVAAARIYIRERDAQHVRLHRAETKLAAIRDAMADAESATDALSKIDKILNTTNAQQAAWPDGTPKSFDNYDHDKRFADESPKPSTPADSITQPCRMNRDYID